MNLSSGGSKKRPVPVMNVTPLVDIALVVLIIFMVIVPMMEKSFWLNLPKKEQEKNKPQQPDEKPEPPLVMTIDSSGTIRVNKAVLKKEQFGERIPRMLAAQPLPVIYFDAADNIPYGQAVEVMDLAKASGAKAIAMLTEKVAD
ncbi:MAG TPA: biopolymer transporter ExbD [Polyangiaceae bacterium]|nr:biopolymer transporter ExbD [Polyangiaceae bacterium]